MPWPSRVTRFLVAVSCCVLMAPGLYAQGDTSATGFRARFPPSPLVLSLPPVFRESWMGAPRAMAHASADAFQSALTARLEEDRRQRARALRYLSIYGTPPPDSAEASEVAGESRGVLGLSRSAADLGLDAQVRLDLRSERIRNERCSPIVLLDPNSGCRGGFKAPRLDNQITLRSGGVISRRIHLNVDYDNQRDFSATNNVQLYYEGLEDEIVRRVEIGTVVFQPPPSRFITAAVPANNFGINATFEVGPVQFQTLAATQKGSVVNERTYTIGQTTSQAQDRQLRDLDLESGRFFWVVDPDSLPGYPALDILRLDQALLRPSYRPSQVRVYRYRAAGSKSGVNPNLGGITALARRGDNPQRFGPVRWELLIQGTDYYLDRSGLWLTLGTKLDGNDYLAVSYIAEDGTRIGTFPEADRGTAAEGDVQAARDTLELIVQPLQGPDLPTFRYEMRQVYRVAGSDLDPSSLTVSVTLNRSERPLSGTAPTYLQQLGLAIPSDPAVFDRENRLFPRVRDPEAAQVIHDSYVVFPHLQPFADRTRLSPAEASDSLYRTPLFLLLAQGPPARFGIHLQYRATGGGDRSTLDLNALQLREGSEQLVVAGRKLVRGVDYSISYDVGRITFLNPESLFGQGSAQVTARFEERGLFAVAPTTILGFSSRYSLGDRGAINLIGLYQREQSAFNRPALGFEASANLIGGVNTELHFKPAWVTRMLRSLTTRAATAPSQIDLNAEFAFTKPDPNRSGQAYLEEFEGDAGLALSLRESQWEFGSRPGTAAGLEDAGFAGVFDPDDAVALTWQNLIPGPNGTALELHPQDIDTLIRIAGRGEEPEPVMFVTLHADTAGGIVHRNSASGWSLPRRDFRPRWRSMVLSLSSTGVDLTRDEFLEFWLIQPPGEPADSAGVRLVVDLGTVSEDALAIAPDSFQVNATDTVFTGRQYVGTGRLDTERTDIGIFNAQTDDIGILGDRPDSILEVGAGPVAELPLCRRSLSNAVPVFPWGDLSSRCTNGNGALDTEDLNGDALLDGNGSAENYFRYVVDLAADSFFVRNGVTSIDAQGRSATWKLYRIPIRRPGLTVGTPTLRLAQHLRLTVAAPPDAGQPDIVARFALARLRFVGSPWLRRSETPIAGLTGAEELPHGEVSTATISTENLTDLGYESPPGVSDRVSRRGGDREAQGTQINEKSLRIIGSQLGLGERAEAVLRFPGGPQNLLTYRTLRVWMRGRGPGWEEGDLQAFVKLGSDDDNFYLYRAPARSVSWEPEFAIDLEVWRRLRAQVETQWLTGQPPSGAAECGTNLSDAYVACEGPYLVHVRDPGVNPPNLARVQQISAGIYRVGEAVTIDAAELWVDDIRLSEPVSRTGIATSVDARFTASDVASFAVSYIRQNGQFRQINEDPSYRATDVVQANGSVQLDRFLPTSLGLAVPLTVTYAHSGERPELLTDTDLRSDALSGVRRPISRSTTFALTVRRNEPGKNWLARGFVDPLSLAASLTKGRAATELSEASASAYTLNLTYLLQLKRRGIRLPLGKLAGLLPGFIRSGEAGKSLGRADLNPIPSRIRLVSGLVRDESNATAFRVPVARSDDATLLPTLTLTHVWRNDAGLTWQPLGMLNLSADLSSTRDLRIYPDSNSIGRLAYSERRFFLGVPVGVERDRQLTSLMALTPNLASWFRPRLITTSSFVLSRTLSSREPIRADGDSGAFILPKTLNNSRSNELGAAVDLSRGLQLLVGDSSALGKALARIRPVDLSTRLVRTSTFDLTAFEPSLGYQLALGGLDRFLGQEGSDALGTSEARTATASSGADLPFGFTFTLSHALTRTTRFQRVGDGFIQTETSQREWPIGSIRWSRTFRGGPLALVAVGTSVRERQGSSTQANRAGLPAVSGIRSASITPDVQVSLRNGMSISLGLTSLDQQSESNGNVTRLGQDDVTGSFSYPFRLPQAISRLRKQVRSSLSVLQTDARTCLEQATVIGCRVISDVRRQELHAGLDTDLMQSLTGGLQIGYSVNDARHLSQRTSEISIIASFQLSLFAGDYR
jgi:Motility related/secretion protein